MHLAPWLRAVPVAVLIAALAGCGDDDGGSASAESGGRPAVVVTTNILGDVVETVAGEVADVTTIMPVGANPHDFQASAQETAAMREADLLVVNGAGFEEGLLDVIESAQADGVPVYEAISAVETLELGEDAHAEEEHADEGPAAEEAEDEHAGEGAGEDEHTGVDPHFFTDPTRMEAAVRGIVDALEAEVPDLDADGLQAAADEYLAALEELDTDVEGALADVDEPSRVLVTSHEVFGYFADRYDFEVVGTVIPGGSTSEGASAGAVAELVEVIEEHRAPAIFADTSSPEDLARTLADEVGDVEVVELFSESLGEEGSSGASYVEMVRTNANRIAAALS